VLRIAALLLLAVALAPPAAMAHSHKKKSLEVVHPWTPATAETNVANVPVYMKLKNTGSAPERLLRATTELADKVELIEPRTQGSMTLPTVTTALSVPAGGELVLSADGPRLLLGGVKKRLDAYDIFKLTLVFEKAGTMEVEVMVEEAETKEPHKH
jgi:periplasmic copper chaperone A